MIAVIRRLFRLLFTQQANTIINVRFGLIKRA